jgi:hypothetical protein
MQEVVLTVVQKTLPEQDSMGEQAQNSSANHDCQKILRHQPVHRQVLQVHKTGSGQQEQY